MFCHSEKEREIAKMTVHWEANGKKAHSYMQQGTFAITPKLFLELCTFMDLHGLNPVWTLTDMGLGQIFTMYLRDLMGWTFCNIREITGHLT